MDDKPNTAVYAPAPDKVDALNIRIGNLSWMAENYIIDNDKECAFADGKVVEGTALKKGISELLDPFVAAAHLSHRAACQRRNALIEPVDQATKLLAGKIIAYHDLREQQRAEEMRKFEEKARKEQEEDALKVAVELEATGDIEASEAVLELGATAPVTVALTTGPSVRTKTGSRLSWEVTSVDGAVLPRNYFRIDLQHINKAITASKGTIEIPGVTYVEKKTPIRR